MQEERLIVSLRTPPSTGADVPPPRSSRRHRRMRTITILAVLAVVVIAVVWHFASAPSHPSHTPIANGSGLGTTSTIASGTKTADVVAQVGALIELPADETPTIATVTDPSKLAGQAFFANAKKGDIVLIYTTAREAYLYDPAQNKLVAVAPITTGAAPSPAPGATH